MKLTEQQINDARKVYDLFWNSYLIGDVDGFATSLDDNFEMIGTSESELCHNKSDGIEFIKQQTMELTGSVEMRNRDITAVPLGSMVLVNEFCDIYVLSETEWSYYSRFRSSTILRETPDGWKVAQQHGSLPDMRVQEGETLAIEKITKENIELRDAVKRRTIELVHKNRELEVEAALERIRSRTMAMKQSEELTDLAQVLFEQMQELSVDMSFASVSIFIFEEGTRNFTQWLPLHDHVTPLRVPYFDHPISSDLFDAWESGLDYFEKAYTLKEKNSWIEQGFECTDYRDLPDEIKSSLVEAPGYAMSIALGKHSGICIPSFEGKLPAPENVAILKRVGKVFEQAYTRFLDLKKAEAQAREAQIEASLEKIRAQSMGMQTSEDLSTVASVMFDQMKKLGGELFSFGIILCEKNKDTVEQWHNLGNEGMISPFTVPVDLDYIHRYRYDQWNAGRELFSIEIPEDYINEHFELMFELPSVKATMDEIAEQSVDVKVPDWEIDYGASFKHGYLLISSLKPFKEDYLFPRFAKVFNQAYTRFLDLKNAEAQTREAKIEAALEKIRSRTNAMHNSEELKDVVKEIFDQLARLSINAEHAGIVVDYEPEKDWHFWIAETQDIPAKVTVPYLDLVWDRQFTKAKKEGRTFFTTQLNYEEKNSFYKILLPHIEGLNKEASDFYFSCPGLAISTTIEEDIGLYIENFSGTPYSGEENEILKRFGKVFQQAYTRFLDLQKAEEQAREAQIETALERVRSRSLAMHKSDELNDVVKVVFEKMTDLEVPSTAVAIQTFTDGSKDMQVFVCGDVGTGLVINQYLLPFFDHPIIHDYLDTHKDKPESFVGSYSKKEKDSFYEVVLKRPELKGLPAEVKTMIRESEVYEVTMVPAEKSLLAVNDFQGNPLSERQASILKRFARVFDQAYIRFLDLQKAEAQAREAEIQLALERVRARTMAMQKSDELSDVIALISEQMDTLQIPVDDGVALITFNEDSKDLNEWMANEGFETATKFHLPHFDHPVLSNLWKAKDQGQKELIQRYSAEESRSFLNHIFQHTDFSHTPEPVKEYCLAAETYATSIAFQKNTAIFINDYSGVSLSDSEMAILHRFAKEFDQTYTRFLDLQKAEAQAREAEVNLAVERVRAKALAMFKSEEILQVVIKLRNEILGLNIPNVTAATIHLKEPNEMVRAWDLTSINNEEGQGLEISLDITYRLEDTHPDFFIREVWEKTDDYFVVIQGGDRYKHTSQWLRDNGHAAQAQEFEEFLISSQLDKAYHPTVQLNNGRMCIDMLEPPDPEVESILKKMAGAFDLAYKRFEDLQKAEAQTREVQIEAALERARAQSMMMQHSDEINTISNAFHEQLVLLGIPSEFSYVWLPDEENLSHQFWASWYEIKAGDETLQSKQVTYPLDKSEPYTAACFAAWTTPNVILEEFIPPQDIIGFFDVWQELLSGAEKLKAEYFREGIYYSEAYMRYGCFGINIRRKLSEEEKNILKRFSKEFERAYTRFLDLQKAEEQARLIRDERDRLEVALNKLEATQDQLIQQEKLASLGQLTAGIAHEIKNPLNFVNNFSDVSIELVQEAREEVLSEKAKVKSEKSLRQPTEVGDPSADGEQGDDTEPGNDLNLSTILEILDDIESNLKTIHKHGSRADSIVKSMLQHSRGGDGKMEPALLNPIIKEYVNLAFHGMRAGNDPINVDIDLQLDDKIGEVPLVAEDFSRVILNLVNNAFDAMREETIKNSKLKIKSYSPKLTVRTRQSNTTIAVEIEDNGPGIPDEIRDKIMQPFFTTKKGTQGTGLGLSITNDIVKAHGGVLTVTSQAGKRTTFTIELPK